MIFGRGGGGGVINRVTKEAGFGALREVDCRRLLRNKVSPRTSTAGQRQARPPRNGLYETPAASATVWTCSAPASRRPDLDAGRCDTGHRRLRALRDLRVADRGITSFRGRPAGVDVDTFRRSRSEPREGDGRSGGGHRRASLRRRVTLRKRTLYGNYDRFFRTSCRARSTRAAARSRSPRTTRHRAPERVQSADLTYAWRPGRCANTLLVGAEVGRQRTENFRNTGFFNNSTTSILAPFGSRRSTRRSPSGRAPRREQPPDHRGRGSLRAGSDRAVLPSPAGRRVAGGPLRPANHNDRNGDQLDRVDDLVSPRAGVISSRSPRCRSTAPTACRTCPAPAISSLR